MNHEIRLYDVIGSAGHTAQDIAANIPQDAEAITVRINSPGGLVSDGLAIYNYLRDHKAEVTTIVDGYAASAASVIMLAGDIRKVHESSIVVIHNPWTAAAGDSRDMRHSAKVLDELRTALIGIYGERTKLSGENLETLLDDETWMRGTVAHEYGFADEVIRYDDDKENEYKQAASVHFGRMLEIINKGNELMSKQLTRKEIEAQAEAQATELDEVKASIEIKDQQIENMQARIDEAQAVIDKLNADHQAKVDELTTQIDTIKSEYEAKVIDLEAAIADKDLAIESKTKEADEAKAALVNPAVADASINNPGQIPDAQLDAEADLQEQAAAEASKNEPKDVAEEYEAMAAGPERVAFWGKHKKSILAIMDKR